MVKHEDAFGLDTDRKRIVRLLFQPLLVLWSLFAGEVIRVSCSRWWNQLGLVPECRGGPVLFCQPASPGACEAVR
jgi:hypothetical protein